MLITMITPLKSLASRASLALATLLAVVACRGDLSITHSQSSGLSAIANLHAFARLYGVVRWFHPSDSAAAIDWDRFAIEGVHRVVDISDRHALRAALSELFAPFAPTVRITEGKEPFPSERSFHPASRVELELVAWQHEGYGDSTMASGYVSKRRHRPRTVAIPGTSLLALSQLIDAV